MFLDYIIRILLFFASNLTQALVAICEHTTRYHSSVTAPMATVNGRFASCTDSCPGSPAWNDSQISLTFSPASNGDYLLIQLQRPERMDG